ncbi:MAG: cupin domain-containing protein [Chloroflexi bacterium]|nr:cupin domain-containing protein [Chloroflexota bacterium]
MATIIANAQPVTDRASTFSVRDAPLLSEGQTMTLLAQATDLKIHLKVHAPGWNGELVQHHHPHEDHMFFVLAGEATFQDEHGKQTRVGPMEGIMLPKGVIYSFENSGTENLVILRAGLVIRPSSGVVLTDKSADRAAMRHVIDHFVASGTTFAEGRPEK